MGLLFVTPCQQIDSEPLVRAAWTWYEWKWRYSALPVALIVRRIGADNDKDHRDATIAVITCREPELLCHTDHQPKSQCAKLVKIHLEHTGIQQGRRVSAAKFLHMIVKWGSGLSDLPDAHTTASIVEV